MGRTSHGSSSRSSVFFFFVNSLTLQIKKNIPSTELQIYPSVYISVIIFTTLNYSYLFICFVLLLDCELLMDNISFSLYCQGIAPREEQGLNRWKNE